MFATKRKVYNANKLNNKQMIVVITFILVRFSMVGSPLSNICIYFILLQWNEQFNRKSRELRMDYICKKIDRWPPASLARFR